MSIPKPLPSVSPLHFSDLFYRDLSLNQRKMFYRMCLLEFDEELVCSKWMLFLEGWYSTRQFFEYLRQVREEKELQDDFENFLFKSHNL